jgi:hypothetical protein
VRLEHAGDVRRIAMSDDACYRCDWGGRMIALAIDPNMISGASAPAKPHQRRVVAIFRGIPENIPIA